MQQGRRAECCKVLRSGKPSPLTPSRTGDAQRGRQHPPWMQAPWRCPSCTLCSFCPFLFGIAHSTAGTTKPAKGSQTQDQRTMSSFTGENKLFMLVSSPCVLYLLWRPGRVCASSGSRVAPTEACKACQCILSKSGQRREPSIMEKTQSPSPGHLDERAGRTSPGSRGSRPIRPPLAERQPGLFCERLQSPVRVSQLTMECLCRFRFHFHQRGKQSTMGQCPRLGNRTRFSLGFPGLGTWKRPEPRQTREAGQILRYAFLVAIKHISSYHLMGSLCLWGKGRCC